MAGLLLSYYGDDFTGSTDVMEAMSTHGVNTVLFTRIPTDTERARFPEVQAIGIAGTSRSQTPGWMDEHLPPVFTWLKGQGARFCLYKVCSTFDSAPKVGNIGRAIEIGRRVFGQSLTPLIVGAPQLKRFTAFGHLFAGYQGETYRIDRHPVMSRHPVTPMGEADLRLHLARQTDIPVTLVPLTALYTDDTAADAALDGFTGIALIDVADPVSQLNAGRRLLRLSPRTGPFVAGSSGVNYALVKALAADGKILGTADFPALNPVERIIAVSGSCSPTTARQIRHALANGFTGLHADPLKLGDDTEVQRLASESVRLLNEGRSVLVYTALDPDSDRGSALDSIPGARHRVGVALGRITRDAVAQCSLPRAILAGGDTSSHALGQLDVFALTVRFPLKATPGSPLCRAWSSNTKLDGLEIAMKGGQVGGDDYFTLLRDGAI